MIKYPISFFAHSRSESGIQSPWATESAGLQTLCSIPVAFEGPGGAISPEDLFAQALTNCFLATFKVYAEKSKVHFSSLQAATELIVDLNEKKQPVMKKAILKVTIEGAIQPERVKLLAERAFSSGFILNSVKTELIFNLDVKASGPQ